MRKRKREIYYYYVCPYRITLLYGRTIDLFVKKAVRILLLIYIGKYFYRDDDDYGICVCVYKPNKSVHENV